MSAAAIRAWVSASGPVSVYVAASWPSSVSAAAATSAARGTLTRLRFHAARHPRDAALAALVTELTADPWFAAHWPDAEMRGLRGGPDAFRSPAGIHPYELVTLVLPNYADRTLVAFAPAGR